MSGRLLVKEAKRRAEIHRNLKHYFRVILDAVGEIDDSAEVYLFGSVAEGTHTYSSDIDVLVITDRKPEEVISKLWSKGIEDPFEIHVINKNLLERYEKRSKLIKLKDLVEEN